MNRSPATIFPHTPRTLLGCACSLSSAFRRLAISTVTAPGREHGSACGLAVWVALSAKKPARLSQPVWDPVLFLPNVTPG